MNLKECKETIELIRKASKNKDATIRDLEERLKYQDQLASELVTVLNEHVPFENWPKFQCPVCQERIDFQKEHSIYHAACQKRAASARSYAKAKQTETLQENAIDTILLMLKMIQGEPLHIDLVFSSVIEIAKILMRPEVKLDLVPHEKEFLENINEAIDKFKIESERQRKRA